jgi:hypothetical protein
MDSNIVPLITTILLGLNGAQVDYMKILIMILGMLFAFMMKCAFDNMETMTSIDYWIYSYKSLTFKMIIMENRGECCVQASDATKAILYIIDKNIEDIPGVRLIREIYTHSFSCFSGDSMERQTQNVIDQPSTFDIGDGIRCKVNITAERTEHTKRYAVTTTLITTKSLGLIKKYVNKCLKEYYDDIQMRLHEKKFTFLLSRVTDASLKYTQVEFMSSKSFDNMHFNGKNNLMKRVNYFMTNKDKYDQVGMPYTLGLLFHGAPGTGKTSAIKAIANHMDRHVIIIPTHLVTSNDVLVQLFYNSKFNDQIIPMEKRLYVFEEIDCGAWKDIVCPRTSGQTEEKPVENIVIHEVTVKNKPKDQKDQKEIIEFKKPTLTLANILEMMDGIIETPGRVIIFTSNHPENLDPALLRHGRISLTIEFTKLLRQDIALIYEQWFSEPLPSAVFSALKDYAFTQAEIGDLFINFNNNEQLLLDAIRKHANN